MPTFPKYMVKRLVPRTPSRWWATSCTSKIGTSSPRSRSKSTRSFIKYRPSRSTARCHQPGQARLVDKVKLVGQGQGVPITGIKDIEGGICRRRDYGTRRAEREEVREGRDALVEATCTTGRRRPTRWSSRSSGRSTEQGRASQIPYIFPSSLFLAALHPRNTTSAP